MYAPFSLKGKINLGSPVNRHRIPFWNWVATNIFDSDTLVKLKSEVRWVSIVPSYNKIIENLGFN